MAAFIIGGKPYDWSLATDDEGHRDYSVVWQVQTDSPLHGPDHALYAPGMPMPGSSLSIGSTIDPWAFYQRKGSAKLKSRSNRRDVYLCETIFTTRPNRRCHTNKIEDPLLEPHKVRGAADLFTREATTDKDGKPLLTPCKERFRGPTLQIEDGWPTIELEQNVAWINLSVLTQYRHAVNSNVWWEQPIRTIRCKTFTWERVLYGTCYFYWKVATQFQLNADTWDIDLLNESNLEKIDGEFVQAKDDRENNITVIVDSDGERWDGTGTAPTTKFRVRTERDFSTVGWPATLM